MARTLNPNWADNKSEKTEYKNSESIEKQKTVKSSYHRFEIGIDNIFEWNLL